MFYRVISLVKYLCLVDLDFAIREFPLAGGLLIHLPTAQAGWWDIPNLSQTNLGTRQPESPFRVLLNDVDI